MSFWRDCREALELLAATRYGSAAQPVTSTMTDPELCALADARAKLMAQRIGELEQAMPDDAFRAELSRQVQELGAKALPAFHCRTSTAEQLIGLIRRVTHETWWRRQLRNECLRLIEQEARHAGLVCAERQVYCTDETVIRWTAAAERAKAMLEATELEAEDGEVLNLWAAVEASTANKANRRAELMTRIRGCEEIADAGAYVGIFTTNTAPSRFHPRVKGGDANPRHDDSTPRQAQQWLCRAWARTRAQMQREGIRAFGFRIAEPHHDGCPHWHMLLWCRKEHRARLEGIMREQWLKPDGGKWRCMRFHHQWKTAQRFLFTELGELEPGASEYRVSIKPMRKGGAAGYVAKYIAKNIDDGGSVAGEGHVDEIEGKVERLTGATAARVTAWASAHHIRQFQPIGQPPVSVWRELRRVKTAEGATARVQRAHAAVHRDGGRRACWRAYVQEQGGPMVGRDYAIRMARREGEREGRYETMPDQRPLGVFDRDREGQIVLSDRREWRPRGAWKDAGAVPQLEAVPAMYVIVKGGGFVANPEHAVWERRQKARERQVFAQRPKAASTPRTRFNNCTQGRRDGGPASLMGAGIVGARDWSRGRKQSHEQQNDPGAARGSPGGGGE